MKLSCYPGARISTLILLDSNSSRCVQQADCHPGNILVKRNGHLGAHRAVWQLAVVLSLLCACLSVRQSTLAGKARLTSRRRKFVWPSYDWKRLAAREKGLNRPTFWGPMAFGWPQHGMGFRV